MKAKTPFAKRRDVVLPSSSSSCLDAVHKSITHDIISNNKCCNRLICFRIGWITGFRSRRTRNWSWKKVRLLRCSKADTSAFFFTFFAQQSKPKGTHVVRMHKLNGCVARKWWPKRPIHTNARPNNSKSCEANTNAMLLKFTRHRKFVRVVKGTNVATLMDFSIRCEVSPRSFRVKGSTKIERILSLPKCVWAVNAAVNWENHPCGTFITHK